jgi:hypothetical protein
MVIDVDAPVVHSGEEAVDEVRLKVVSSGA